MRNNFCFCNALSNRATARWAVKRSIDLPLISIVKPAIEDAGVPLPSPASALLRLWSWPRWPLEDVALVEVGGLDRSPFIWEDLEPSGLEVMRTAARSAPSLFLRPSFGRELLVSRPHIVSLIGMRGSGASL